MGLPWKSFFASVLAAATRDLRSLIFSRSSFIAIAFLANSLSLNHF